MQKKIVYTNFASEDILNIFYYISRDSFNRAKKFALKLILKIDNLKEFPQLGINNNKNTFILVIDKNYLIKYRIEKETIYILTIRSVKKLS
jgi:plasmid stabilization system protein ParE